MRHRFSSSFSTMMRLDSQTARELIKRFRGLLQEKSTKLASNVRNKVNAALDPEDPANSKIVNAKQWYEEFTGIDEVRRAQERVIISESKFIAAQESRRQASKKLSEVQSKMKEVYGELEKTRRGEDRYIFLVTQEHALMKEEEFLSSNFQQLEQEERENFSILSSAVKESHEKERLQAERTKYWSVIGSILGTVLGVVGSSINNRYKMNEFRSILTEAVTNEQKLEVLISDKLAERLEGVVNVAATPAHDVKEEPSREALEHFYEQVLAVVSQQQQQARQEREAILLGTAVSAGCAFLLYKLLF